MINWLNYGGAEVMLCNLLDRTDLRRFDPVVVSLIDVLPLAARIEARGVPVRVVGMRPGVPDPRGFARMAAILRAERPDVIQGWMYHANLVAGLASAATVRAPVAWGIHHTHHDPKAEKRSTLWTVAACARLSRRLPARIVCCSESARRAHERRGFAAERMTVIPNGIDTEAFRPDPAARAAVRRELGLAPETPLIGLAARYSPQKDPMNFLRAAALLKDRLPDARFVICGTQTDPSNLELVGAVEGLGLRGRCLLLGPRADMPRLMAAFDLLAQSSVTEAFPLTLCEAMACGVPCAATDVGDSATILGKSGRIVPPRDPKALADACADLLGLSSEARALSGAEGRRSICARFELGRIVHYYEDMYESLYTAARSGDRRAAS